MTVPSLRALALVDPTAVASGSVTSNNIELFVSDGADITTNIAAAIAAGGANTRIALPEGDFYVSSTVTIPYDRVHIRGAGMWATRIIYTATTGVCFDFVKAPASIQYQGSVLDMAFSATNTTGFKVAISFTDVSSPLVYRVAIGPIGSWTGSNSIGIRVKGRECGTIEQNSIAADIPIRIQENPNVGASIDLDFDVWTLRSNLLYASATNACIHVDDGVYLTSLVIDGSGDWITGKYGLYWNDTTTAGASYNVRISGHRAENLTNGVGAWAIYLSTTSGSLKNVVIDGVQTGDAAKWNGYYFRGIQQLTLRNVSFYGFGGAIALDMDETCTEVKTDNCFWQQGSVVNLGNLEEIFAPGGTSLTTPAPPSAVYQPASLPGTAKVVRISGMYHWRRTGTLAAGATYQIPVITNPSNGSAIITATAGGVATPEGGVVHFAKNGKTAASSKTTNFDGILAGGKFCVFASSPTVLSLNNGTASSMDYTIEINWYE